MTDGHPHATTGAGSAPPDTTDAAAAGTATPAGKGGFSWPALLERDGVQVSQSPWGATDHLGRMNWMTDDSRAQLLGKLDGRHVFDLAVDYFLGMPAWVAAGDPKYEIWMTHTPNGSMIDNLSGAGRAIHEKNSYCGDSFHMYTHTGTHMDLLNHLGYYGVFWNGLRPEDYLGSRCWSIGGAEEYPPIVARGVLLDIAALLGVDCLPPGHEITPTELADAARRQGLELRRGDVVLLHTGQMQKWDNPDAYLTDAPGVAVRGARYLCEEAGAMSVGTDTIGVEVFPSRDPDSFLPVHCYMFATAGAPIVENVWLEELAAEGVHEFAFLAFGLKLRGSTGAPMRPVAVPLR